MFSSRFTVFFEIQVWKIFMRLEHQFFNFKPEINHIYLNVYFKGIKILRVLNFTIGKKKYVLQVFLRFGECNTFSGVLDFTISVKIRNESLIVNQCNCYQTCYRNSNFLTISGDMRYASIIILIWLNIREKESQTRQVFNFSIFWLWNFSRIQNFAKIVKITTISKFNTLDI